MEFGKASRVALVRAICLPCELLQKRQHKALNVQLQRKVAKADSLQRMDTKAELRRSGSLRQKVSLCSDAVKT